MNATEDVHELLAALTESLTAYDVETRLGDTTLVVIAEHGAADTVSCRPRADDADQLWFLRCMGEPIPVAERPVDAAAKVAAYLGAEPVGPGGCEGARSGENRGSAWIDAVSLNLIDGPVTAGLACLCVRVRDGRGAGKRRGTGTERDFPDQ